MELVKGVPITEFCDQNQVPIRERLELFLHVCQAIQHAHQKGIIHRDIKPSNVLVMSQDGKPVVKVIDFGVAKAIGQQLTDKTIYTQCAQMVGTPLYMSPEQAGQGGLDVDTRSDIYSLGVLLYQLLTGTTPFDKERLKEMDFGEIRRIIREEEPARPSQLRIADCGLRIPESKGRFRFFNRLFNPQSAIRNPQLQELDWIVMKALEKDRNRRYQTANGFAMDVQRYLHDEPVEACPPSAWYRLGKFARRKKTALAITACAFVALAGVAGALGWAVRDREARKQQAAKEREMWEAALDSEVKKTLDETGPLIEQGKWREALAVAQRADKLLAAAGRTQRPARLLELQKELSMARRLEETYREPQLNRTARLAVEGTGSGGDLQSRQRSAEDDFFWGREQDACFAREFRDFGIDVEALAPAVAAERIRRTSIRLCLVQALDEWAPLRRRARGHQDPLWKKLVEIARQADADPWRSQFRGELLRRDRHALEKLADKLPIRELAPATAYLLGHTLRELGAVDKAMAVLREAQRHHPDDFWLNDALGLFSKDALRPPRYDDSLRYYAMTLALRPHNARTHRAVAEMLEMTGALDEAVGEYTRALELDPKDQIAVGGRGDAHYKLHRYEKAVADYSKGIELGPNHAVAWLLRRQRGAAHAALSEWTAAAADYAQVAGPRPYPHWHLWYEHACLRLLVGDAAGHAKVCAALLERAEQKKDMRPYLVARACTLAPLATANTQRAARLATELMNPTMYWSLTAAAALEVRLGRCDKAELLLRRCLKQSTRWDGLVLARLWLVLALHAQGKGDEARRELAQAQLQLNRWGKPMPSKTAPGRVGLHLHDWLEIQVLRREAERILVPR
jgi:tetratricopeptide (TPR) repeat protein